MKENPDIKKKKKKKEKAFSKRITDLSVLENYVCNLKTWRLINDVFIQFCYGCIYVTTAINKGMYTKLWTEDDSEGCRLVLDLNNVGRVFSILESKIFPIFRSNLTVP